MLENFLEFVIPPSLLFSDDHYDDFKLIGLKCLSHIVKNAVRSLMCFTIKKVNLGHF